MREWEWEWVWMIGDKRDEQPTSRPVSALDPAFRLPLSSTTYRLVDLSLLSSTSSLQPRFIREATTTVYNKHKRYTHETIASPMVDGRVEPHRKATYTLEVSEQMRREDRGNGLSSVKCMVVSLLEDVTC
jgi:hypothetical protein